MSVLLDMLSLFHWDRSDMSKPASVHIFSAPITPLDPGMMININLSADSVAEIRIIRFCWCLTIQTVFYGGQLDNNVGKFPVQHYEELTVSTLWLADKGISTQIMTLIKKRKKCT